MLDPLCIKIDKPLEVCIFCNVIVMMSDNNTVYIMH